MTLGYLGECFLRDLTVGVRTLWMWSAHAHCRCDVVSSCSLQMWYRWLTHAHCKCGVASSCSWRYVFLTLTDCVLSSATNQTKPLSFAFLSGILLQPWVNNTYPTSKVGQPFTEGTVPLLFLDPLDLGAGCGQEENVNYMHPQCESIFDLWAVIQEDFSWGANKTMHTLN